MSTRAQIIITDEYGSLWFYRHSDGYPEGAMPLLEKFMDYIKKGIIRNNVEQASGWLILFGAREYDTVTKYEGSKIIEIAKPDLTVPTTDGYSGWKCGAIEPSCPALHGDIEYLYVVDLETKTIKVHKGNFENHIPKIKLEA